jgi:hypothetical protein
VHDLVPLQQMCGSNTCAHSADVKCLGELYEFYSGGVRGPQEDGDLEPDSWKSTALGGVGTLRFLRDLDFQLFPRSTGEPGRTIADSMPDDSQLADSLMGYVISNL